MASISHFLVLMVLIQGITVLSNGIPMVEASRALASSDSLTPPPPSNSARGVTRAFPSSAPPSPHANRHTIDSKSNKDGLAVYVDNLNPLHGLEVSTYPSGAVEPLRGNRHLRASPITNRPSPPRLVQPPPAPRVYRPSPPQVYRPSPPQVYRPPPP